MSETISDERRILGVRFFTGKSEEAVERMMKGGLLVVPAAPALKDLPRFPDYRASLVAADLVITDSAFMVLVWNRIQRDNIPRISGLRYLRALLDRPEVQEPGSTFWIMPGTVSAKRNLDYLRSRGIQVPPNHVYIAPQYDADVNDEILINQLHALRPRHVIVTIGGGTQERLGLYIKRNTDHLPAIHCIGAAIAFLSGDQVSIPDWADRYYLGWLLRCVYDPRRYIPRYWGAVALFGLLIRYRDRMPPLVVERDG